MNTRTTSKTNNSETEELKRQVLELQNMLNAVLANKKELSVSDDEKLQPSDYIQVMSLLPYHLNLSTKEKGQGKTFKFEEFGQIKRILYTDLVDILEVHDNFSKAGYFYILDKRVIRNHGLDDAYAKILTKEKIEAIISGSDKCVELYNSANDDQKNVIIQILVDKIVENPDNVDLNLIDKLARASKVNIMEKVENIREFAKVREEV